ncbi:DNA methyltransferase, partial [Levilactobacillus spicheri]|uniref:DNA methyltransferase n=1 Tax=Levilactobacillus spicheri TaxID=216463 RepID=UPI000704C02F
MIDLQKGDCLELMKKLPDNSVDAVICDLPYGTTNCKWDTIIPFEPLWHEYKRIIKLGGAIVLFGTEPFTSQLVGSNLKWYREHLTWIKHRPSNFANAKYMHMKYTEDIIVFGSKRPTFNRQMMRRESPRIGEMQHGNSKRHNTKSQVSFNTKYAPRSWNVYDANWKNPSDYLKFSAVANNSKEKTDHPTQKPVKL